MDNSNKIDKWNRIIVSSDEIFDLFYNGISPSSFLTEENEEITQYNKLCKEWNKIDSIIQKPSQLDISPEEKELQRLNTWFIPEEYTIINVRQELLQKCNTIEEKNRINMEMDLYEKHNLIKVLQLMMYLVDVWKRYNIVWGVGRGSSVASYVLYLIGIHKINSLKYNLDIKEFLK